jgi:hypothetical protein
VRHDSLSAHFVPDRFAHDDPKSRPSHDWSINSFVDRPLEAGFTKPIITFEPDLVTFDDGGDIEQEKEDLVDGETISFCLLTGLTGGEFRKRFDDVIEVAHEYQFCGSGVETKKKNDVNFSRRTEFSK